MKRLYFVNWQRDISVEESGGRKVVVKRNKPTKEFHELLITYTYTLISILLAHPSPPINTREIMANEGHASRKNLAGLGIPTPELIAIADHYLIEEYIEGGDLYRSLASLGEVELASKAGMLTGKTASRRPGIYRQQGAELSRGKRGGDENRPGIYEQDRLAVCKKHGHRLFPCKRDGLEQLSCHRKGILRRVFFRNRTEIYLSFHSHQEPAFAGLFFKFNHNASEHDPRLQAVVRTLDGRKLCLFVKASRAELAVETLIRLHVCQLLDNYRSHFQGNLRHEAILEGH